MDTESIVLGGGCFWCLEAVFQRIKGVQSVQPGYAGGDTKNPAYEEVCTGETGHAEVVKITFNSEETSLERILETFWKAHNPTTLNRQGADVGSQYRSIILFTGENQKKAAGESLEALTQSGRYPEPPVTEIQELKVFWPAEEGHRNYYNSHSSQAYCKAVIEPKLRMLKLMKPPCKCSISHA